ncbi:MAG: ParB/RepB/Spo0J family partition protein [Thermoanaerobaculia bacterium]|nr:ParB/RepB/Spo0J family partition protein [Thermoanaerobaculia bacterium]
MPAKRSAKSAGKKVGRRGLGKGLDALLGSTTSSSATEQVSHTATESAQSNPTKLSVGRLEPNRFQPRTQFDESGLEELAESIRAQGVVQPIVVTPKEGSQADDEAAFVIVAGERRWRASQRAGLQEVPVVVREVADDRQLLELALVENVQRADLNPVEEAEAYRTLAESFGLSQEDIAARVGKGRTTVTNFLRLLRLPQEVQDLMREGRLTAGQARPLLALPDKKAQIALAERAVKENLTARDLEALVQAPKPKPEARRPEELDVHTREAVEKLTQALQTKVAIRRKKRGGTVQIHFHSEDELIRLYEHLMGGEA